MDLTLYGWNARIAEEFMPYRQYGYLPARISLEQKTHYMAFTEAGEIPALVTGKFSYEVVAESDMPVVGDWVAVTVLDETPAKALIHAVLPRGSRFSRQEPGKRTREQVVAANIDTVFCVIGLDANYRASRIERYLSVAWESGAAPVVLLTKADLCDDVPAVLSEAQSLAPGVPVHAISVLHEVGIAALAPYCTPGNTMALLGSSGVGKSTLLNRLLGSEAQRVQEVREQDSRGRHTTTTRQMFTLPGGALMIDTPGLRELQLWDADEGLSAAFTEIEALARNCRYVDCRHEGEPGCRIQQALVSGELSQKRFESYQKLQRELAYQARRIDHRAEMEERLKWKRIAKDIKAHFREQRERGR